jgi:hypothetical protein
VSGWARFTPVKGQPDVWECRAFDRGGPYEIYRNGKPGDRVIRCDRPFLKGHARIVGGAVEWIDGKVKA